MAIFLKKFETHTQYDNYINGSDAILPNVSICTQEGDVHYNSSTPTPSHDFVEIGGLKWATMNVGANSITDAGLYFQWGDTQGYTADQVGDGEGQKYFDWENYKYAEIDTNGGGNGSGSGSGSGGGSYRMTKYNDSDGKTVLDSEDDAVTAAWGDNWRMPTTEEFAALGNAVNTAWTGDYKSTGVAGMVCTAKDGSGAQLFFPAAGYCNNGSVFRVGSNGRYWSGSLYSSSVQSAYFMDFRNGGVSWRNYYLRYLGFLVRGVVG